MNQDLIKIDKEILSSLILNGDISKLNQIQRVQYVTNLCERMGLDPLTQPFKILKLQGKEVLYADKGCTQQLCKVYKISTEVTKKEKFEDVYVVTVRAIDSDGRFTDEDGVVTISSLKGDMLANALMKAVTKAKRRAVLAFCGLGMLDETEIETIPGAKVSDITIESIPTQEKAFPFESKQKSSTNTPTDPKDIKFESYGTDEDKITEQQGTSLLMLLAKGGFTKQDLKEYIFFEFNIEKLSDICNSHLVKIKEHFTKKEL